MRSKRQAMLIPSRAASKMNNRFKVILAVRFSGYLVFFIGVISFIFMMGPLVQAEASYRLDRVLRVKRTVPKVITSIEQPGSNPEGSSSAAAGPVNFSGVSAEENSIIPVSTEYGIVIEKINANAKVIAGVNPANEREYVRALTGGVAEALGSTPPGQPGNLYLFSHSTDAPWNIVRFNAIFYLLRELTPGDRVIVFYKNRRYDYIVFDKSIVSPTDVSYLTNKYDYPVLTLQTCDPPGTLLNRLIIRAKLVSS
ncbi:MAG: sortase [Candidatus Daviesbacteria bacterium]|nr:sortase [Candidatus Daviesbacteria bacterium]